MLSVASSTTVLHGTPITVEADVTHGCCGSTASQCCMYCTRLHVQIHHLWHNKEATIRIPSITQHQLRLTTITHNISRHPRQHSHTTTLNHHTLTPTPTLPPTTAHELQWAVDGRLVGGRHVAYVRDVANHGGDVALESVKAVGGELEVGERGEALQQAGWELGWC